MNNLDRDRQFSFILACTALALIIAAAFIVVIL